MRHNQALHVVTFRASGRPHYVTSKQELLVFHTITAFRCESDDGESDLTPMQEEVIVGARHGALLYTKLVHTLSYILISFFSINAFIPHQNVKFCILLQTIAFYSTFISRYSTSFSAVTPSNLKSTFYRRNTSATHRQFIEVKFRKLLKNLIRFVSQMIISTTMDKSSSVWTMENTCSLDVSNPHHYSAHAPSMHW